MRSRAGPIFIAVLLAFSMLACGPLGGADVQVDDVDSHGIVVSPEVVVVDAASLEGPVDLAVLNESGVVVVLVVYDATVDNALEVDVRLDPGEEWTSDSRCGRFTGAVTDAETGAELYLWAWSVVCDTYARRDWLGDNLEPGRV